MSYNKSCLKQKIWRINSINYDSVETSYVTPLRPYNKFVACFVFRFRGPCRTRSGEKRATMKILVGCTGSVATIKVADLVRRLAAAGHQVQVGFKTAWHPFTFFLGKSGTTSRKKNGLTFPLHSGN